MLHHTNNGIEGKSSLGRIQVFDSKVYAPKEKGRGGKRITDARKEWTVNSHSSARDEGLETSQPKLLKSAASLIWRKGKIKNIRPCFPSPDKQQVTGFKGESLTQNSVASWSQRLRYCTLDNQKELCSPPKKNLLYFVKREQIKETSHRVILRESQLLHLNGL